MAEIRTQRQALTDVGILRRLGDADFDAVKDPRIGAIYPLSGLLELSCLSIASRANSQRGIEGRSEQLSSALALRVLGSTDERVADNTVGTLLARLYPQCLRECLHRQVKAEHRRGNLQSRGRHRQVAIDGKCLATLHYSDLVRAARRLLPESDTRRLDRFWRPDAAELRRVLAVGNDWVQVVAPAGREPHGLVRMHRSTLVSCGAAVCLDEVPIGGQSNEVGSICTTFKALEHTYRRGQLFDTVTTDAGNTSLEFASLARDRHVNYFLAIAEPQGDIYALAEQALANPRGNTPLVVAENRSGDHVEYSVWVSPLPDGYLAWGHARQLVRIRRRLTTPSGEILVGNRYYVTSMTAEQLTRQEALSLSRWHWRCENEGHWTADAIFNEDARRAPLSRNPQGMLVGSLLRCLTQNILAMLRELCRRGPKLEKPTWREVAEYVLAALFTPYLNAQRFNAVPA